MPRVILWAVAIAHATLVSTIQTRVYTAKSPKQSTIMNKHCKAIALVNAPLDSHRRPVHFRASMTQNNAAVAVPHLHPTRPLVDHRKNSIRLPANVHARLAALAAHAWRMEKPSAIPLSCPIAHATLHWLIAPAIKWRIQLPALVDVQTAHRMAHFSLLVMLRFPATH